MLLENSIVEPSSSDIQWFPERAIFLGMDKAGCAVFMPLLTQTKGPERVSMTALQNALEEGTLTVFSTVRPALKEPDSLSNAAKKEYDAWEPHFRALLAGERRDELLEAEGRKRTIAAIMEATKRPNIAVRRMLYKILRAGRHLYGICNDFSGRGAPGVKQEPGTNKRGRKPLAGGIAAERPASDFRARIEAAVQERVITNGEKIPVAFRKMTATDFSRTTTAPNGKVKTVLLPEAQRPTLKQFRAIAEDIQHRGLKRTRLNAAMARPGTAKDGVLGPGFRYEIDATGGQLELVSEFDLDQAIGPANAYGLLDVWLTVCVGGAMGVFNAGYNAAQVALFNTFTSKKELCERWDIDIDDEVWPCHHVPRYITSDRGELVSDASEALPTEFNIILQTAAPYVPQMKGSIEGWFSGLKSGDIRKLVGFGRKMGRTQRDPKHDAALTRYDAMRAFLLLAIKYNHQAAPKSAIPPQMIEQGYEQISRIALWQWGMRNLMLCARIEERGYIYTSLLRKTDASIRDNGLFVEGVKYMSPEIRSSGLLQRAAKYGAIAVEATIDDFLGNTIWFRTDMDAPWQPAFLADEKLRIYNASFRELVEYNRKVKNVHERSKIAGAAYELDTEKKLLDISNAAVERKRQQLTKPKSRSHKNVRAARAADAQNERREHGAAVVQSYAASNPAKVAGKKPEAAGPQAAVSQSRLDLVKSAFMKNGG